jgi:regulator of replication initiation timing
MSSGGGDDEEFWMEGKVIFRLSGSGPPLVGANTGMDPDTVIATRSGTGGVLCVSMSTGEVLREWSVDPSGPPVDMRDPAIEVPGKRLLGHTGPRLITWDWDDASVGANARGMNLGTTVFSVHPYRGLRCVAAVLSDGAVTLVSDNLETRGGTVPFEASGSARAARIDLAREQGAIGGGTGGGGGGAAGGASSPTGSGGSPGRVRSARRGSVMLATVDGSADAVLPPAPRMEGENAAIAQWSRAFRVGKNYVLTTVVQALKRYSFHVYSIVASDEWGIGGRISEVASCVLDPPGTSVGQLASCTFNPRDKTVACLWSNGLLESMRLPTFSADPVEPSTGGAPRSMVVRRELAMQVDQVFQMPAAIDCAGRPNKVAVLGVLKNQVAIIGRSIEDGGKPIATMWDNKAAELTRKTDPEDDEFGAEGDDVRGILVTRADANLVVIGTRSIAIIDCAPPSMSAKSRSVKSSNKDQQQQQQQQQQGGGGAGDPSAVLPPPPPPPPQDDAVGDRAESPIVGGPGISAGRSSVAERGDVVSPSPEPAPPLRDAPTATENLPLPPPPPPPQQQQQQQQQESANQPRPSRMIQSVGHGDEDHTTAPAAQPGTAMLTAERLVQEEARRGRDGDSGMRGGNANDGGDNLPLAPGLLMSRDRPSPARASASPHTSGRGRKVAQASLGPARRRGSVVSSRSVSPAGSAGGGGGGGADRDGSPQTPDPATQRELESIQRQVQALDEDRRRQAEETAALRAKTDQLTRENATLRQRASTVESMAAASLAAASSGGTASSSGRGSSPAQAPGMRYDPSRRRMSLIPQLDDDNDDDGDDGGRNAAAGTGRGSVAAAPASTEPPPNAATRGARAELLGRSRASTAISVGRHGRSPLSRGAAPVETPSGGRCDNCDTLGDTLADVREARARAEDRADDAKREAQKSEARAKSLEAELRAARKDAAGLEQRGGWWFFGFFGFGFVGFLVWVLFLLFWGFYSPCFFFCLSICLFRLCDWHVFPTVAALKTELEDRYANDEERIRSLVTSLEASSSQALREENETLRREAAELRERFDTERDSHAAERRVLEKVIERSSSKGMRREDSDCFCVWLVVLFC